MQVTRYKIAEENYWIRIHVAGKVLVLTQEEVQALHRQLHEILEVDGERKTDLDERF